MILVPVDFSPISVLAMRYAVMLGNYLGHPIKLFHAIPVHSVWLEEADLKIEKEAEHELHQLADQMVHEGFSAEKVSTLIVHRFPLNSVIDDLVEKEGVKYIVMGTSGASGLKEHLLGSFTSGVIETSKVPVIAIPENTKIEPFRSVVYATDLTHLESECKVLVDFIRSFNSRLNILNIRPTAVPEREIRSWSRNSVTHATIRIFIYTTGCMMIFRKGSKHFLWKNTPIFWPCSPGKKTFLLTSSARVTPRPWYATFLCRYLPSSHIDLWNYSF